MYHVVNRWVDTLIINCKGELPETMAEQLMHWQEAAKELEEDITTDWTFGGCPLFMKPHGSGKGTRWIVHHPDTIHLAFGKGKLNGIVCKLTFRSVYLHSQDIGLCLKDMFDFMVSILGYEPKLQVSELHQCVDIAGWELTSQDTDCFVSRGSMDSIPEEEEVSHYPEVKQRGRRVKGLYFSKTAPHSCAIYNKTNEIAVHHKQWFEEVWRRNGWDGESIVTRVEFRYERECLRDMKIECPYEMLDKLDNLWAYSSQCWLRHTIPSKDTNQTRWKVSEVWQVVQSSIWAIAEATPAVRVKKVEIDIDRTLASFTGYATSMAARLVVLHEAQVVAQAAGMELQGISDGLPDYVMEEDGGGFFAWVFDPVQNYLHQRKQSTFKGVMTMKVQLLGQALTRQSAALAA